MYYYVYKITDTDSEKYYIGSRSSRLTPVKDLGIQYFSSSSNKHFLYKQEHYPEHFTYEVLEEYPSKEEALAAEMLMLKVTNARNDHSYYNGVSSIEPNSIALSRSKHIISYLGNMIKLVRKEHRMSCQELAERVGITRPTIIRMEAGTTSCSIGNYIDCCCILGIDLLQPNLDNSENISNLMNKIVNMMPKRSDSSIELFDDF